MNDIKMYNAEVFVEKTASELDYLNFMDKLSIYKILGHKFIKGRLGARNCPEMKRARTDLGNQ